MKPSPQESRPSRWPIIYRPRLAGFTEYGLGQAYFVAGRYRDAEACLNRAIARLVDAPENVPPGTTGSSLLVLCYMMKVDGLRIRSVNSTSSERCTRQASDLAQENGQPYDLIAADYSRGFVHIFMASWKRRKTPSRRPSPFPAKTKSGCFCPYVLCALGNVYLQTGRAAEARTSCLRRRTKRKRLGTRTSIAAGIGLSGFCLCATWNILPAGWT